MTARPLLYLAALATVLSVSSSDAWGQRKRGKQRPEPVPPPVEEPAEAIAQNAHEEYGPTDGEVETVDLRLGEVVRSAIAYAPAVRRSKLDWQIANLEIGVQTARYSPILTGGASARLERNYNEFALSPSEELLAANTGSVDLGLRGWLRSGGRYSVAARSSRLSDSDANGVFRPLTPLWTSEISARLLQPLARGRGYAANGALIDRERITVELRQAEGNELLLAVALRAVSSYWALVLRREELVILETNVAEAITLLEIVERRVRAGQDAQSSIVEAAAVVAGRRQAVEASRVAIVDAERELLGTGYLNDSKILKYNQVPVPIEAIDESVPAIDFAKELAIALKNRPEAKRMEQEVRLSNIDRDIARDALRPRIDLYAEGGLRGLAGTDNVPANDAAGNPLAQPPDSLVGGASDSFRNLAVARAPFFEVGVQIEIPLDNQAAQNSFRQAKLAVLRAQSQDVENRIALDVRAAAQRVRIASSSLRAAKESLRLAEENVEAQRLRYRGGGSTLFDVTRSQDDVTKAKARIALARAQIAVAQAGLEAARGTLLGKFGIETRFRDK